MRKSSLALVFIVLVSPVSWAVPPVLWTAETTGSGATDVASSADGGVVVSWVDNSHRTTLTHYSSTGAQLWQIVEAPFTNGITSMRTDPAGNIYTVGSAPN